MIDSLGSLTGQFGALALHLSAGKGEASEAEFDPQTMFYTFLEVAPELIVAVWRNYLREASVGSETFSDDARDRFQESIDTFLESIKRLNAAQAGHEKQFAKLISAFEMIRKESDLLWEKPDPSKLDESKRALREGRLLSVEAFANELQRG